MSVCKRAFQTTTTEATNADVCKSVFRVITAKVFPSSRFRLKRCDHLHLEEEEISVGRGGGEKGLAKGERREVWEKGLMRKGRCSLKKMRVVFSFFKSRPAWINTSFLGLTFKYRLSNTYTCLSLKRFYFSSPAVFTRNCIVQNLQNGRSKMQ